MDGLATYCQRTEHGSDLFSAFRARRIQRLLNRHGGESGALIYGDFNWLRSWDPLGGWSAVTVEVDGQIRRTLDQLKPGPEWLSMQAGHHRLDFSVEGRIVKSVDVVLSSDSVVLVAFRTPKRAFFGNMRGDLWSIHSVR